MYYGGIDALRSYLTVAIVDASGALVRERKRVPIGDGEPLLEALEGLRPLEAVAETCPFWPWIHDTLEPTEVRFHLAHCLGHETAVVKAFAHSIFELERRRIARGVELVVRFKLIADDWNKRETPNWDELHEGLRHEWTDVEVG